MGQWKRLKLLTQGAVYFRLISNSSISTSNSLISPHITLSLVKSMQGALYLSVDVERYEEASFSSLDSASASRCPILLRKPALHKATRTLTSISVRQRFLFFLERIAYHHESPRRSSINERHSKVRNSG